MLERAKASSQTKKGNLTMLEKLRKLTRTQKFKESATGYAFFLPALILLSTFMLYPMFTMVYYSFTDFYILKPDQKNFVWFENFMWAFKDERFIEAFKNTVHFVVLVVPLQTAMALLLALLVNSKIKFKIFFRTAYFSPVVMSLVVVSILWSMMYDPNNGLINQMLQSLGLPAQPFLESPDQAMNSIIAMSVWQGAGFQMLIFLAGLQDIPKHRYEAASIDGANMWQKFWHITLPGLRNVSVLIVITITIAAFRLFVQPMVMTQGGPLGSTRTVIMYVLESGFTQRDVGYGSAIAVIFTLLVLFISIIQRKLMPDERG